MPKYRVETNQGIFEVEADTEPTVADIERHLASQNGAAPAAAQPVTAGSGPMFFQNGRPRVSQKEDPSAPTGLAIDLALEAGIPAAAQALTAPGAALGVTSAVGAGASVLGNLLAQTRRVAMGEQEGYSGGQVAQAGVSGAIPFVGPARTAERLSRPVLRGAMQVGKNAALQGATGFAGEATKTLIDEGRMPSLGEGMLSTAVPGALGGAGTVVGIAGNRIRNRAERVLENANVFGAADIPATPGMLDPEELAAIESRIAKGKPGTAVAKNVDRTREGMTDTLNWMAPNPREGSEIFDEIKPLLGKVSQAEGEISKLNEKATIARERVTEKFRALQDHRIKAQGNVDSEVKKAAETAVDEAFTANLDSVLDNARQLAVAKTAAAETGIDPATARNLFVDHVAKPLQAAFEEKSAQMYSLVDAEARVFDAAPILAKADELALKASGTLPQKLKVSVQNVRDMLQSAEEGMQVSLQDLRNTRAELLKRVQMGQELGSYEERMIKDIASEITQQIEKQAVTALGEEGGEALKAANKFYSETRQLFDSPGVDVLFSPLPTDEYVRKVVGGMKQSGINSDEYVGLKKLADKIGEFNPELKEQVTKQMQDNLRQSIIHEAAILDPVTGKLKVDGAELVKRLEPMARVDGTMGALGFGSRENVVELKRLFDRYPDAPKLSADQWEVLTASPMFQSAKGARDLKPAIEPYLAAASADTALTRAAFLRNAGQLKESQRAYDQALNDLDGINGDKVAAQVRYDNLLNDPIAVSLNNPKLQASEYNTFARAFFDPKANAVTNAELSGLVQQMRNGPPAVRQTLTKLQERYIADKIAAYQTAGVSSELLQKPDAETIAIFFNPTNPGDAAAEIARAKAILDPDQIRQLENFSKVAKAVDRYEKLGTPLPAGSKDIPFVGAVRRGFDALVDQYRERKYFKIAESLADPSKFVRVQTRRGERFQDAGQALVTGAQGAGRVVDERLDQN